MAIKKGDKHDWEALKKDWMSSNLNLKDFAGIHGMPAKTLYEKKIKVGNSFIKVFRTKYRDKNSTKNQKKRSLIKEKLENADNLIKEKSKVWRRALEQSSVLAREIMSVSAETFATLAPLPKNWKSAGEAARVSLHASTVLREVTLDMQGIPHDGDSFGWPMTKGFWPHWYQRDFIFDLPSNMKIRGEDLFLMNFVGGIRSGKTRCGAEKAGDLAFRNRGFLGGIYAPTYRILEDSTKAMFFKVLRDKEISFKYRASDNSLMLFGDTKIIFRSMDNPDHNRGTELAWFWIDEGGQLKTSAAFDVIMGRCSADCPEPAGLITTTPNGMNWLYDEAVGKQKENRSRIYHAHTDWNTALAKTFVERLGDTYDERYAKQELRGLWIDVFAGQAYWNFDRSVSINDEIKYEPDLPLILAFDLNVDPMCWNIMQQRTHKDGYKIEIILDEIHIRSASTEAACKEFIARYGEGETRHRAGVNVYGDSTCRSRTTKTTRTDYKIIEEMLSAKFPAVEMHIGRSNPGITDSVAAVNARLKNLNAA
jgi:hypothetical protein